MTPQASVAPLPSLPAGVPGCCRAAAHRDGRHPPARRHQQGDAGKAAGRQRQLHPGSGSCKGGGPLQGAAVRLEPGAGGGGGRRGGCSVRLVHSSVYTTAQVLPMMAAGLRCGCAPSGHRHLCPSGQGGCGSHGGAVQQWHMQPARWVREWSVGRSVGRGRRAGGRMGCRLMSRHCMTSTAPWQPTVVLRNAAQSVGPRPPPRGMGHPPTAPARSCCKRHAQCQASGHGQLPGCSHGWVGAGRHRR